MENKEFGEELKKRIYNWVLRLIKCVEHLPNNDSVCRVIVGQLLRSGTSIGANYIEANNSSTSKSFALYIEHALKSGNESKFWLALLRDTHRGDEKEISVLLNELIELTKILASSLRTMRNKKGL